MRRLKDNAIYLLSFIITLILMIGIIELTNNFILSVFMCPVLMGFSLIILNSLRFGGK